MMQLVEVIRCPIMMQSRLPLFPICPMIVVTTEQFRPSVGQKVGHYCEAILLSSYPPQSNRNCTLVLFSYTVASCWYAPFKVVLVPDSHTTWPTILLLFRIITNVFDIAIKLWEHTIETKGLFKQSPSPLPRATMEILVNRSSVAQ